MSNLCQAGHSTHDKVEVNSVLGNMWVYHYDKYKDFNGYCTGQDDISRTIVNTRMWEPDITEVATQILKFGNRDNVFVDIGSHIGWFSRLAENQGYKVMAYDGDSDNIESLNQNTLYTKANLIWFEEGTQIKNKIDTGIELMKIDIEGAEQYAIKAFEQYLGKTKNILMEVSPVFNDSYPALIQKLVEIGFTPYEIDGSLFNFDYSFAQTNLLFKRN